MLKDGSAYYEGVPSMPPSQSETVSKLTVAKKWKTSKIDGTNEEFFFLSFLQLNWAITGTVIKVTVIEIKKR